MPMRSVSATSFLLLRSMKSEGKRDAVTAICVWPSFLWPSLAALLSLTRTNPSQYRSRKFCASLPQPVCTLLCSEAIQVLSSKQSTL